MGFHTCAECMYTHMYTFIQTVGGLHVKLLLLSVNASTHSISHVSNRILH